LGICYITSNLLLILVIKAGKIVIIGDWRMTKHGFTLAEVLVTLGIIGVVSALTIPTLIANYKKSVYVTQLKKSVSSWEQAFQKMKADDGVDNIVDTTVFSNINGSECALNSNDNNCKYFFIALERYIKITNITTVGSVNYKFKYIKKGSTPLFPANNGNTKIIFLNDGSAIMNFRFKKIPQNSSYSCSQIESAGGHLCQVMGQISIDINGLKGPNTNGRDIFDFTISEKGKLIPFWSKDSSIYTYLDDRDDWSKKPTACGTKGIPDAEQVATYGSGCSARVIANGWKMDY